MKKINILSKNIYNRIAAGEVIDRPYSAVKELIENSLDAHATEIEIYVEKGGKQLIKVIDNGTGIDREDMQAAFMPHATSKISRAEDLEKITTLGFRGEALASISVIAKVELTSVTQGNDAYRITCEDGHTGEIQPAALEKGTVICVRDLFYNTPVRAKFMKPDKKEEADITSFIIRYVLCNPKVSFKYYTDGKLALQSFGGGLDEAVAKVYGAKVIPQCFRINAQKDGIKLEGFIGNTNFFKPNKTYQSIFLNGRYIVNNTIATAISNAYASYMMKRQYPFYVLNVEVPADMVDVNVHPNKSDVRFVDNRYVFGVVYKVISSILDGSASAAQFVVADRLPEIRSTQGSIEEINKVYSSDLIKPDEATVKTYKDTIAENADKKLFDLPPRFPADKKETVDNSSLKKSISGQEAREHFDPSRDLPLSDYFDKPKVAGLYISDGREYSDFTQIEAYARRITEQKREQQRMEFEQCKFKGNLFNTYLIYELRDEIYLIDQHAAHERLIYDGLRAKLSQREIVRQGLLYPYLIDASPTEAQFINENLMLLRNMGFSIEPFGVQSYRIDEVPADVQNINISEFFKEFLSQVDELKEIKLEALLKEKIAQTACKHAVKGGMALTEQEIDALFKMLDGDMGLKCPHGRPICVKLSKREIEKMFKRIV